MAPINLSENDTKLLKAVVGVMQASIDWEQVRVAAEMKTIKYARDRWAILRTKLTGANATGGDTADGEAGDVTAATTPKPKKTPTPRKRKATAEDGDDEETPKGRKKKAAKKGAEAKSAEPEAEPEKGGKEDGDNIVVKTEEPNSAGDMMDDLVRVARDS